MFQLLNHLNVLLLNSLQYLHISFVLGSPEMNTVLQVWPHQFWAEGKDHLLITFPLMQSRIPFACFEARVCCWPMVLLLSTRTPWSFSAKLLSSWVTLSKYWCMELFLPRCRTLKFSLLHFIRFLPAHFSNMLRPTGWHQNPLVYQPLLPVLCRQQTCWECTLPRHPDH